MRSFVDACRGAAAMVLALALPALATGCGPGTPEVDKSALYTPESLADELAFRYRALKPDARKFSRARGSRPPNPPSGPPTSTAPDRPRRRGEAPRSPRSGPGRRPSTT